MHSIHTLVGVCIPPTALNPRYPSLTANLSAGGRTDGVRDDYSNTNVTSSISINIIRIVTSSSISINIILRTYNRCIMDTYYAYSVQGCRIHLYESY